MREIKFRAWHKELHRMFSAEEMGEDQLTLMPDGRGFANISSNASWSEIDDNKKMIPLQYTGLKDKNGVEIYEGDVVKSWNITEKDEPCICEVYWNKNFYAIKTKSGRNTGLHIAGGEFGVEVIGNIYEESSAPQPVEEGRDEGHS